MCLMNGQLVIVAYLPHPLYPPLLKERGNWLGRGADAPLKRPDYCSRGGGAYIREASPLFDSPLTFIPAPVAP